MGSSALSTVTQIGFTLLLVRQLAQGWELSLLVSSFRLMI
jgi:hypothetical protein